MAAAFELREGEFRLVSGFLRDRFGLDYPPSKKAELEKVCGAVAEGRAPSDFCNVLTSPRGRESLQRLVNQLTVGETYFFRIQAHFDALKSVVLPDIYDRRDRDRRLRIWSAGCATGEEPYSVAMLILETLSEPESWDIDFLATDINTDFIAAARQGRYRKWSFRKVGDYWRGKYFRFRGDEWELTKKVLSMVRFAPSNLLDERDSVTAAGPEPFDLIICRNVLIYFDGESIERVGVLFRRYLAPGGWYIGGHVEPLFFDDGFEPVNFPGAILYRKLTREETPAARRQAAAEGGRARRDERPPANALEEADRFVAVGDDVRALERLTALSAAREDAELYWRMGRVLGNLGRYEEALEWCRRGSELDRSNPRCYYMAALIQEEMGRHEEAFENLRRSLYVAKDFVLGHFSMGNYYRWRRDEARAARSYRNVLKLLEGRPEGEEIEGDGLTVSRLREVVSQIL